MKSISILLFFVFFAVFSAHNQLYHEAKELKSFGNMIKFISELKKGGQLQDAINEEDLDSNSRLLISGFLDSTLNYTWNSTFLNMVNNSIFNFENIKNAFLNLSECNFNFSDISDIHLMENASSKIQNEFSNLINGAFPYFKGSNQRNIPNKYETIYKQIAKSLSNYNSSTFVYELVGLSSKYDLVKVFGLLKLWIELRIHKGGLEWGQLDLNLSKLHNPISITDNSTHFSHNTTNYTSPQKFFFGIVTEKFRKNWTQSIIPLVNETNFDYTIIMNSSNIFALNIDSRNMTQFSDAVNKTYLMIEKCLDEIFHNSNIISEYDNIFEFFNDTANLYSDAVEFGRKIDLVKNDTNLTEILLKIGRSMVRGHSSAGFLWARFNDLVRGVVIKNKTQNENETDNENGRLFVKGLIQVLTQHNIDYFIQNVNFNLFDYKRVISSLKELSEISFNFSKNHTWEEIFVENIGFISLQLYKLMGLSYKIGDYNLTQILNVSYNIFASHSQLFTKIKNLLRDNTDIRYYFAKSFELGNYFGNFESSGNYFGLSIKTILEGTNKTNLTSEKKFLKGFFNYYLHDNFNMTILNKINSSIFNEDEFLNTLMSFQWVLNNNETENITLIMNNLLYKLEQLMENLFPMIGYGYRYGIVMRNIPSEYRNIYEILDITINFYQKLITSEKIPKMNMEEKKLIAIQLSNLSDLDDENKGVLFAKLNEKLHSIEFVNDFHINFLGKN